MMSLRGFIRFRTLNVEVYRCHFSEHMAKEAGFRTLNVEVYLKITAVEEI